MFLEHALSKASQLENKVCSNLTKSRLNRQLRPGEGVMIEFAQCLLAHGRRGRHSARHTHGFFAAGRESHCSVHRSTVVRLARTYRSPLLFCDPEVRTLVAGAQGEGCQRSVGVSGTLLRGSSSARARGS